MSKEFREWDKWFSKKHNIPTNREWWIMWAIFLIIIFAVSSCQDRVVVVVPREKSFKEIVTDKWEEPYSPSPAPSMEDLKNMAKEHSNVAYGEYAYKIDSIRRQNQTPKP